MLTSVIEMKQNPVNLTQMAEDHHIIIKYSDYQTVCMGNHLLLLLYLGCTPKQRSIPLGYLLHLLAQGRQRPLLYIVESS